MFFPISPLLPLSDYPLANFHLAAASLVFDESNHEDSGKVHHSHFLPLSFFWLCLEPAPKQNSSCHFRADAVPLQQRETAACREAINPCWSGGVQGGPAWRISCAQAALTSGRSQLSDVLGGFVVRILSGHHLVPLAALFVQHVWDLQCSLSLCSQVQILLSKVSSQLPDFKLEEKTTPQTDVM